MSRRAPTPNRPSELYNLAPIGPAWAGAHIDIVALTYSFESLSQLGYVDPARSQRDEAVAKARQRAHAFTLAVVLGHAIGFAAFIRCDAAAVLERADELATYCAEHGLPYWGAIALLHRGNQLVALDRRKQGLHVLMEAWDTYRAIGAVSSAPGFLIALARLGQTTEGLKQIDQATRHIEATDERCREAPLHRTRGQLVMAVGDPAGAEIRFQRAIAVAHQQNAKVSELRAATSLASLWRNQGKRQQAQDLLAPIYGWFTEGFDTLDLKEAKSLLEQLKA